MGQKGLNGPKRAKWAKKSGLNETFPRRGDGG
jgi:hypothetical protein